MKLACPHCNLPLNMPDRFAGRKPKCPACRERFQMPGDAPATATGKAAQPEQVAVTPTAAIGGDELALSDAHGLAKDATALRPSEPIVCPSCGTDWVSGAAECKKCHYNRFVGGKARRGVKRGFNVKIDTQKVFLYLAAFATLYLCYWMYNGGWDKLSHSVNKTFDDASRPKLEEENK
ncbi:MAG TPA: hypothetical protein VGP72_13865 [Planctomycetota bacterium]|jgi:ribosomal protein L40E